MLIFPAVLINFLNSEVFLIRKGSIQMTYFLLTTKLEVTIPDYSDEDFVYEEVRIFACLLWYCMEWRLMPSVCPIHTFTVQLVSQSHI